MSDLLLPPGTRMIHIGPSKTGSTAIQNSMFTNRAKLLEHGVNYAGGGGNRAREAGWAIVGGRAPVGRRAPRIEKWHELVREVQAAGDHRVAHSNENYGRAKPDEIATIVKDLGGGRPHVVSVVRRLDGLLPSYWQERVKARETRPYEEWLELVLAERPTGWQWFNVNYPHDVRGVVDRWGREVGEENITLIVADGRDRGLLPRTFEGLLGLPAGTLTLEESDGNRSLTYNEAEMLRRFNVIFGERGWSGEAYAEYVQRAIVPGLRSAPAADDHVKIPGVPQWAHERIRELAERQADAVRDSGVRVVGDPEELRAVGDPSFGGTPEVQLDLDTAARMAGGLVDQSLRLRKRTQREVRRVERRRLAARKQATVGETASLDLLRVVGRRARNRLRRK